MLVTPLTHHNGDTAMQACDLPTPLLTHDERVAYDALVRLDCALTVADLARETGLARDALLDALDALLLDGSVWAAGNLVGAV